MRTRIAHRFSAVGQLQRLRQCAFPDPLLRRTPRHVRHYAAQPSSLVDELKQRGLVSSITGVDGDLSRLLSARKTGVYAGIDPTASSLHVGHLLPLMCLLHFNLHGHNITALIGDATGAVGDPSGRSTERDEIKKPSLENSKDLLAEQAEELFKSARKLAKSRGYNPCQPGDMSMSYNSHWLAHMNLIQFLSKVGKHVRLGNMLARDSVKLRMESAAGINFAEFSYQLLQSYDFYHLWDNVGVQVQVGGSDQWGNITAGIDLIQKMGIESENEEKKEAFGLTVPLLTTPSGEKFGKSAGNAVWLNPSLTSPYELYQFFVRLPDSVVESYLKMFTFLPLSTIASEVSAHFAHPERRSGQHLLAKEVVTLIHGDKAAVLAKVQTALLFSADSSKAPSADEIIKMLTEGEQVIFKTAKDKVVGDTFVNILFYAGAVDTKSEAKRLMAGGGLYAGLEGKRVEGPVVEEGMLLDGKLLILKVGKAKLYFVETF